MEFVTDAFEKTADVIFHDIIYNSEGKKTYTKKELEIYMHRPIDKYGIRFLDKVIRANYRMLRTEIIEDKEALIVGLRPFMRKHY